MIKATDLEGFWIHRTLKYNIDTLIMNAANDFDFIIVISGQANTRTGKSTLSQQLSYYISYHQALLNKKKHSFSLEKNIVFSGGELIKNAMEAKSPNCFVYDEAREGLNTSRFFSNLTQQLLDFFAECGMLNHFLILVLPDFFELPKGLAVDRSVALLNVYYTRQLKKITKDIGDLKRGQEYTHFQRGKFDFYNRKQKKELYNRGKRWQDYNATKSNFRGDFTPFWIVDKDAYNKKKLNHIRRNRNEPTSSKYIQQRDAALKLLYKHGIPSVLKISAELKDLGCYLGKTRVHEIVSKEQSVFHVPR